MVQVCEYLRSAIRQIYKGTTPEALQAKGMEVVFGAVSFVDPHILSRSGMSGLQPGKCSLQPERALLSPP